MSFPRLALLALGLPLLTGGCAVSAVTAASYGVDGASYADSGKSTSDHFMSMVSKKDCALWRVFRNESICHARDPGAKDPYHVNYDTAERVPSEDGVSYAPPLHQTADEPASSWTADAYAKKPDAAPAAPAEPVVAAAEPAPAAPPVVEKPVTTPKPAKKKAKAHGHTHAVAHAKPEAKPVKKASPNQVASVP
ncbi:MAG TPA: hypothetical protein VKY24_25290 [Reyranella sp.]|jgi:hypothetical protein|nr:hypothetical protein [Reyranella sp.]